MSSFNYGKWICLKTSDVIVNLSICVQEGENVRSIEKFSDYNLPLVLVYDSAKEGEQDIRYISEGQWVRCLAVTLNPQIGF